MKNMDMYSCQGECIHTKGNSCAYDGFVYILFDHIGYRFRSSTRIPKDVTDTLVQICVTQGNMDIHQAEMYIAALQKEGRYVQDCWS